MNFQPHQNGTTDIFIFDVRRNILMKIFLADKQFLVLNKLVTTCSKMSHQPLKTTIIDYPYVVSGSICGRFLFQTSFSKQLQVLPYYQYTNLVIRSLEGERWLLHTTIVPKTIEYISDQLQRFRHILWRNVPLFVLSHSHRYFVLFIGINGSRDAPGRKQFFPCQLFSLANLASTVLVCMIWQNNTMEDCSSLTWSMSWNTPNWSQANYRQTQFRRQLCPNINYSTMETYTPVIDPPDVFVTSYAPPSLICNSCHIIKE